MLATLQVNQAAIARKLRCSRSAVGHWMTGHSRPDGDARLALRDEYGIPIEAWQEPYSAPRPEQQTLFAVAV